MIWLALTNSAIICTHQVVSSIKDFYCKYHLQHEIALES